jgi:hypothetical protein
MSEHYIVTLDHGHLRIYEERHPPGQQSPALHQVEAMDFPQGKKSYTDRDSDMAGRFPSSKHQAPGPGSPMGGVARTGMSIDERLPMQREEERRRAKELAEEVDAFFRARPEATWDFAAGPQLNTTILELVSRDVRERLRRSVSKDLVNQRVDEVRAHFAGI